MASEEYKKRKVKYIRSYNKKHYKALNIMFREDDPEQMEIFNYLQSRYSTAQYIRDLVKADMKKEGNWSPLLFCLFFFLVNGNDFSNVNIH